MTEFIDQDDEEAAKRRKKGDSGEGDSDSFGRGKAGAGAGGGRPAVEKLSTEQMREVWANFKHYVGDEVMTPLVEFFREAPARASANCKVAWEGVKNNPKAFAIVNWALKAGSDAVKAFDKAMGAGASGGGWAFKTAAAKKPDGRNTKGGHGQKTDWVPKPGR